jgi:hypothetical protein
MTVHGNALRSSIVRNLLAVAASVPLVALPLFWLWVHRFLKDYRTGVYAIAFVVALAIAIQIPGLRLARGQAALMSSAWRGAIAGYLAGLVAYVVLALIIPDGASKLINTFGRPLEALALVLASPIFLGGWLYGALVGAAAEWLRGQAEASPSR